MLKFIITPKQQRNLKSQISFLGLKLSYIILKKLCVLLKNGQGLTILKFRMIY